MDEREELMGRGARAISARRNLKNAADIVGAGEDLMRLVKSDIHIHDPAQPWRRFLSRGYEPTRASRVLEFETFDDFCGRWLEVSWDELMHRLKPCPKALAYLSKIEGWERGKASAIHQAKAAEPMGPMGGDRRSDAAGAILRIKKANQGDNVTLIDRGNRSSYIAARLARDHPDILERMKRGEFRSVRAAALEAGIVKPQKTYTGSPLERATKALRDLSDDERAALLELIAKGRA